MREIWLCVVAIAMLTACARAGYIVSLESQGLDALAVAPGDTFNLDVRLTADATETHTSAIVRLAFSTPGLEYSAYEWASPYLNGTIEDDSLPHSNDLPLSLDEATLAGPAYPVGAVDLELSNVLPAGESFGEGIIARLTLHVPLGFDLSTPVEIAVLPDEIASGGDLIPTRSAAPFLLVPAPAPAALLLAPLALGRRRRRHQLVRHTACASRHAVRS